MNKKGSTALVMLMMGILFFILGLALAPALKDVTGESRSTAELNCTDPAVLANQQSHAVCTQIDMFQPLLIGILFGLAGLLIAGVAIS
jgi:uncharacterized membrane protein